MIIPFNVPDLSEKANDYVQQALASLNHCGNHAFGQRCIELMKEKYGFHEVFLCYNCGSFIGSVGGDQLFGMLIKSNPEVVLKLIQAKMLIPIRDFYAE